MKKYILILAVVLCCTWSIICYSEEENTLLIDLINIDEDASLNSFIDILGKPDKEDDKTYEWNYVELFEKIYGTVTIRKLDLQYVGAAWNWHPTCNEEEITTMIDALNEKYPTHTTVQDKDNGTVWYYYSTDVLIDNKKDQHKTIYLVTNMTNGFLLYDTSACYEDEGWKLIDIK